MSFSDSKDARIARLASHKVAAEALGPMPRTAKGEVTLAAQEKYKELFVGFCDWLMEDCVKAGDNVASGRSGATMSPPAEKVVEAEDSPGLEYSLDDATALIEKIKRSCVDNPSLKQAVKLKLVALGAGNHKSLDEAVMALNASKATELDTFIDKEQ